MITLGIETSCDETSVALLHNSTIITNAIFSQLDHGRYGGVVPEIASRAHLEKIDTLTRSALTESGMSIGDLDLIAVTDSPGLAGALLVGVSFALGLHTAQKIPITGVNHLEGHICSALLENPDLEPPFLALVVSGGHTAIYVVKEIGNYDCLGQTVDDAAGEAFDKVGKLLGFRYPAGQQIEEEAAATPENAIEVPPFPVARCSQGAFHFSFSGLKTAVKYYIDQKGPEFALANRPAICRSFQQSVVDSLVGTAKRAAAATGIKKIVLVGGVACNGKLRKTLQQQFPGSAFVPQPKLCTDNAAMIALAGYKRFCKNESRFPAMNPSRSI